MTRLYLRLRQVAERLGLPRRVVRRMVREGRLTPVRPPERGVPMRFRADDVARLEERAREVRLSREARSLPAREVNGRAPKKKALDSDETP